MGHDHDMSHENSGELDDADLSLEDMSMSEGSMDDTTTDVDEESREGIGALTGDPEQDADLGREPR